jgi:hypothetical protein
MDKFIFISICILLIWGLFPVSPAIASQKDSVKTEKISYGGWNNCIRMTNRTVELIATTDVGPRIIRYGFVGKENEFFEIPSTLGKTDFKEWVPFGGHRLWIAPEEKPKTYFPDSSKISYEIKENTLRLIQPVESYNDVQKEMIITMDPASSHVGIVHQLTYKGNKNINLAPWSITQMEKGGIAIFPQEDYAPHPDSPEGIKLNIDKSFYLPIRTYALWSYTNLKDPRFKITGKYIMLKQDPQNSSPQKIGMSNRKNWGAYTRNGHLFLKKSSYDLSGNYPDAGSSFESYVDGNMLEMETLGPLVTLKPGESITHKEDWYLFDNSAIDGSDESIDIIVKNYETYFQK